MIYIILILSYVCITVQSVSQLVTINNTAPRLDNTGQIIDGHDMTIRILPNGTYILYTVQYGLCTAPTNYGCDQTADKCGFRDNHNITIWISPDLSSGSWIYQGLAFNYVDRPVGIVYRPDAIYNAKTGLWVLWFNLNPPGQNGIYITAVSSSPFGPFSDFQQSNITIPFGGGGDFHLFNDEEHNQTGYIIWSAGGVHISQLTSDFRNWQPNTTVYDFPETFCEAPALFKVGSLYVSTYGRCCCFCFQGSGLFTYTATNPLGPWTIQSPVHDLACESNPPPPPNNPFCAENMVIGNINVTLECVNGVIDSFDTALYGVQTGYCPNYEVSPVCNYPEFLSFAQTTCIGKSTCVLSTDTLPDPCVGTEKSIAVVAHCSASPGGYSPDGPVPYPVPENPFCGYNMVAGNINVSLQCINGVIDSFDTALYGLQSGTCPYFEAESTCNYPEFLAYAQSTCIGQSNCTLTTDNLPDPCLGTVKSIAVVAHCSEGPGGYSPNGFVPPSVENTKTLAVISVDGYGAIPTPGQGCLYDSPALFSITHAQQSAVVTVPDGKGNYTYIYYGDMWGHSPDGIKGHEPHYTFPLQFNPDGTFRHITWNDTVSFYIDVAE